MLKDNHFLDDNEIDDTLLLLSGVQAGFLLAIAGVGTFSDSVKYKFQSQRDNALEQIANVTKIENHDPLATPSTPAMSRDQSSQRS